MEQLKSLADLLDLHDIDLQIDKLLDDRGSLPEMDEYRIAHERVAELTRELTSVETALKQSELGLDKTNGELEIAAEKAASEQNRLYAGGLSARDADYLRREVDLLYGKVSRMEDDVLMFMEQRETHQAEVQRLTAEVAEAEAVKSGLASSIREQWRLIDKELAVKEERKAVAVQLVDDHLLEVYEDLREHKTGRVVGRLVDGVCGSCHLSLSPAEVARVTKEDPPRCIHCRSILVV